MTLERILDIMNYTFPMLVVKVNGQLIKREDYKSFNIPEAADVKIIHMVAGG